MPKELLFSSLDKSKVADSERATAQGANPAALLQRLAVAPGSMRPAQILQMQRAVGNRATTQLLQTKLKVGGGYEQEADPVAKQVVPASREPNLQRAEAYGNGAQMQPKADYSSPVRRAASASAPTSENRSSSRGFVTSPAFSQQVQRAPSAIRDDYSDAAVFSAGSMMDDEGNFAGPSLEAHDATRAQMIEEGAAVTERAIRIRMLADKVRQAYTRKQEEQARLVGANADRQVNVLGVFTAPEWFFKKPGTPFSKADKDAIVEAFRALSETCTEMLIVPGTIVWVEGGGGIFAKRRKMYGHAPVLLNGHVVKMHQKMLNAADTQGYFGSTRADSQDSKTYKAQAGGGGAKSTTEMPTGKAERAYFRGQAARTSDIHGTRVTSDSSLFDVGNLNVSLEICGDHSSTGRAKAEKAARGDGDPGAHIQIVVSHGASFTKNRSVLRPGGIGVGNDGGEGTDSLSGVVTEQKGTREVWQKGEDNRFGANPNERAMGEADLDRLHMGTYRLPT